MASANISIQVDAEAAKAYAAASPEERRKLELLLSLRLQDLTSSSTRPLNEIMDEIGREAEARGLTPAVLQSLLNDR